MDQTSQTHPPSKVSIVGLFAILTFVITIPLAVLLSEQQQNLHSSAAEPTPVPSLLMQQNQKPGFIAGYVYLDTDENGQRDNGEKPLPQITVTITTIQNGTVVPGSRETKRTSANLQTDANGYFILPLPNVLTVQSYLVQVNLPPGYKTVDTNPVVLSDLRSDARQLVSFGLFPIVTPTLGPTCIPRPACLSRMPKCLIAEPAQGWCPVSLTPTKVQVTSPNSRK